MRILQIRFSNLNSLLGEWQVDLTDPAYVADGIFAITGPTGAGKTTLLDAICLALYGRTPRLLKLTQSANDIMSRQAGECFAEVVFETAAGRYRSHWSQHRARKKPGAALQSPKHEIADADTGEILEASLRATGEQIERLTGMDFERFTRSMLLAQGGFAAFLQAGADERAPILEQITGTAIYSQISMRTHDVLRVSREQLALLKSETQGIVLLDAAQEEALQQGLVSDLEQEQQLRAVLEQTRMASDWLARIAQLKTGLVDLELEGGRLQAEQATFEPVRQKIAMAQVAAGLQGRYATVRALRTQHSEDLTRLPQIQAQLPALETALLTTQRQLDAAKEASLAARDAVKAMAPVVRQVRDLDHQLVELGRSADLARQQRDQASVDLVALDQHITQTQAAQSQAQQSLDALKARQHQNGADAWLVAGLAGLEERVRALTIAEREFDQKVQLHRQVQADSRLAHEASNHARVQIDAGQKALEAVASQREQCLQDLALVLQGRLLREYRSEKDSLLREMALLARIADLETERSRLEGGKPCPLCGSLAHPFAEGQIPVADQVEQRILALTELISRAEDLEALILAHQADHATLVEKLAGLHSVEAAAVARFQSGQDSQTRLFDELQVQQHDLAERQQALEQLLAPLGVALMPGRDPIQLIHTLTTRRDHWLQMAQDQARLENTQIAAERDLLHLLQRRQIQHAHVMRHVEHLEQVEHARAAVLTQRRALFGDVPTDAEERRLQETQEHAETQERQLREKMAAHQQQLIQVQTQVQSLQERIAANTVALRRAESAFLQSCTEVGFVDEGAFLAACLPRHELQALLDQAQALGERHTRWATRLQDHQDRLAQEQARQLTHETAESLRARHEAEHARFDALTQSIARARHRLADNEAAKMRVRDKQSAIEAQDAECRRWENLHALIGSADGKKYRNFAQGLTFEMMVRHANQRLQKMTDRYFLVRDVMQPLELNVVDTYQAGEVRSTRNLSGGESFIVSLSLALGLSAMASNNVRVDSLFLDEGFGTLDEDALDTALETLAGLHQEGKLIGIISHVSALKARIGTQIQVIPKAGGHSALQGPGCRYLG